MWVSTVRGLVAAAAVAAVGVASVPPASAEPGGHHSWRVHQEALGTAPAQDSDLSSLRISVTGDSQHVTMTADQEMSADFSAPAGRSLEAGQTFVARSDSVASVNAPGLLVARQDEHCGVSRWRHELYGDPWLAIGTFTVREAAYDVSGAVTSFAVTFEQNCQNTGQPVLLGSLASNATDVPVAVPAGSPAPAAVSALAVTNTPGYQGSYWMNATKLTWDNPRSNWAYTYVGYGGDFSWRSQYLGGGSQVYRGTGAAATALVDGIQTDVVFEVIPISPVGRLGPAKELSITGTRMPLDISREHVTMGGSTVLTGRLVESFNYDKPEDVFNGRPLVGRTVEVYSRPLKSSWNSWKFLRRATTGPGGRFTVVDTPDENTAYEVRFRGSPQYLGNSSYQDTASTTVAPQVDLVAARSRASRGGKVKFSTARTTAGSRGVVQLQRFDGTRWQTVATKRITKANGRASKRVVIRVRAKALGRQPYRLVKPGDARHVHGVSRTVHVTVRRK
ncbi:MAG: hypothetical protein JWR85_1219 [Marmoricola sp.]|nr:hypothetical protein [Marmoricola sp.]